jgi:hypothetical protein
LKGAGHYLKLAADQRIAVAQSSSGMGLPKRAIYSLIGCPESLADMTPWECIPSKFPFFLLYSE